MQLLILIGAEAFPIKTQEGRADVCKCTGLLIIPELLAYSRPFFPHHQRSRQTVLPLAHLVMAYCFPHAAVRS
jgi:hypothetical protein